MISLEQIFLVTFFGGFAILFSLDLIILTETMFAIRSQQNHEDINNNSNNWPDVTALIVAYLPNEENIILDTINYFLNELDYPTKVTVMLVYNTPKNSGVISELERIQRKYKRFVLLEAKSSISKSENLNFGLKYIQSTIVGIFDADSRPCRNSFKKAVRYLNNGYHCVQGTNLIRKISGSLLERLVAIEFYLKNHFIYKGRMSKFGVSYFAGRTGFWSTDVLKTLQFKKDTQVEDIDLAIRAILSKKNLIYVQEINAFEEAPPGLISWWRQRIRWEQGWAQLFRRYQCQIWQCNNISFSIKGYWTYMLLWRRLLHPVGIGIMLAFAIFSIINVEFLPILLYSLLVKATFQWIYVAGTIVKLRSQTLWKQIPIVKEPQTLVLFVVLYPFYDLLKQFLLLRASIGLFIDPSDWRVTPRKDKGPS